MPAGWIEDLGITDSASGYDAAWAARERIFEPARRVIGSSEHITIRHLVFQGFMARAQGLHEAATQATRAENPHAAFTLLRAYAENAAAILYAKDKPTEVDRFWDRDSHGIRVGRIISHADSRFGGFRGIYRQLSEFAHPQALGILTSTSVTEDGTLNWSSATLQAHRGSTRCLRVGRRACRGNPAPALRVRGEVRSRVLRPTRRGGVGGQPVLNL